MHVYSILHIEVPTFIYEFTKSFRVKNEKMSFSNTSVSRIENGMIFILNFEERII